MIFKRLDDIKNDRTCKALTGLTRAQFKQFLQPFEAASQALREEKFEQGELKIKHAVGRRGYLETQEQRLFFILFYLKNYPTYDVLGHMFGFSGGHAYGHLKKLIPILQKTLSDNHHLPLTDVKVPQELHQAIEEQAVDNKRKIIIDATERPCVRPQDKALQKARYSGKKNTTLSKT